MPDSLQPHGLQPTRLLCPWDFPGQVRILEWVAISFSRGSSQPRDRTRISCTSGRFFTDWATREAQYIMLYIIACYSYTYICMIDSVFQVYSQVIQLYIYIYGDIYLFFFSWPHHMACWILSSLTRDWTCPPLLEVQNLNKLDCQGSLSNTYIHICIFSSIQFSCSVVSDSLQPHELQHARPPCPSPTPGIYSNSCLLSQWCLPTISSFVVPFSSHLQSFSASGSFPMSQLFASGGQSIGVSALTSVLPTNTQDWCPLGWTGWISLQSKGLSRVYSNTTVQKYQFFGAQLSSQSNSHIHTWPLEKPSLD